jgi:hypothetical protein
MGRSLSPSLIQRRASCFSQQQTAPMPSPTFGGGGGAPVGGAQAQAGSGGGAPAPPRQRVRARRGQATDPHSIAERVSYRATLLLLLLATLSSN